MTGDEIMVVERVHQRALDAGIEMILQRLPRDVKGDENQRRSQSPHSRDLGGRGGLDDDDGARNTGLPRGIGDALPGVAGADRPHAAPPLGGTQHGHRVHRAAYLVGVGRLQILQLQPDVGKLRPQIEPHQRRAQDHAGDALSSVSHLGEGDRVDGSEAGGGHGMVIRFGEALQPSCFAVRRIAKSAERFCAKTPGAP